MSIDSPVDTEDSSKCLLDCVLKIRKLNKLSSHELELLIGGDMQHAHDLLMAMGHFIDKTCGNLNKIYEKTTELSISMQSKEIKGIGDDISVTSPPTQKEVIQHIKHSYGPDLIINNSL